MPKQPDVFFDNLLEKYNINENDLTFTCEGPMEKEVVYCCPIDENKLIATFSTSIDNTTEIHSFVQLVTSIDVKNNIQNILISNITNNSLKIIKELSSIINLDTCKRVIDKYPESLVIVAVTEYVLKCFEYNGVFDSVVEDVYLNKFNWVSNSCDRECIFEIGDQKLMTGL
jgi:hypothetical protein